MNHQQLISIIRAAIFTPGRIMRQGDRTVATWGLPLVIWDEPGTGKTSAIEALGRSLGLSTQTLVLGQMQPEDVGGFPVPREDGTVSKQPDGWVRRANESDHGLIIFDEFSLDPERQAAALRVFSDRHAGDVPIHGGIRFLALANPPTCAAVRHEMSPPMANRFGHLDWVGYSVEEYGDWLLGAGNPRPVEIQPEDPAKIEEKVLAGWTDAWSRAAALVRGYLRRFPDHMHAMPQGRGGQGETDLLRWPSRRTWEMATRALASSYVHGLDAATTDAFIAAFLPAGVAHAFSAWAREQDLPDPVALLSGSEQYEPGRRIDRTVAVLDMLAGYLAGMDHDDKRRQAFAVQFWTLAGQIAKHEFGGKDLVVPACKVVARPVHKGGPGLGPSAVPEAAEVAGELMEIMLLERKYK